MCTFATTVWAVESTQDTPTGGEPPAYFTKPLSRVANHTALLTRHWVPGLQEGFIPQGLAWHADKVFIAGYTAFEKGQDRGPCSVARIDARTGKFEHRFDLPADCGHAGGLAFGEGRTLYASDSRRLYVLTFNEKLEPEGPAKTIKLGGELKGSFIAWQAESKSLWIGTYDKNSPARAWRFTAKQLAAHAASKTLSERDAAESTAIPAKAQGAVFDAQNRLWVAQSGMRVGRLSRVEIPSGKVLADHDVPVGIEGLAFDSAGRLWSVSEAGARKYYDWPILFPLVFAIDIEKLK